MRVLFDTNVVVDLLANREPFVREARALFAAVERGAMVGCLCGTTVTTVHYLLAKHVGHDAARVHVGKLLALFEVIAVNRATLQSALLSPLGDFEDAVLLEAALQAGATCLVTRNGRDFWDAGLRGPGLRVLAPIELVAALRG